MKRTKPARLVVLAVATIGLGAAGCRSIAGLSDLELVDEASGGHGAGGGGMGGSSATERTYAIQQFFMGDVDWNGASSPDAWRQLGFDLDGLNGLDGQGDHCILHPNASPEVYIDGEGGIDNSFGQFLLPTLVSLANYADSVNGAASQGLFNSLMWIDGLTSELTNQTGLTLRFYDVAPLAAPPAWDGKDGWSVTVESLTSAIDIESAIATFVGSTLDRTLVGGTGVDVVRTTAPETLLLGLFPVNGSKLTVPVDHARLQLELSADRSTVTRGLIGGVIDTEVLIQAFRQLAGSVDPTYCDGGTFDLLADTVRAASDIRADGTQDPSLDCNAISIGIGFVAPAAEISAIAPPAEPPSFCP